LALAAPWTFSWAGLALFVVMTFVTACLGITLGYHRLLTHRSFNAPKPLQYLLALFGLLALQNSPLRWVATHRLHHKETDNPRDPHSSRRGFWWSHMGWLFVLHPQLTTAEDLKRYAPDMARDPVFQFLDSAYGWINLGFALLVFTIGVLVDGWQLGLSLLIWGVMLRIVYVWHITWLVNSATHRWGYQRFATTDSSRNTWWVALLTFGEGWHNNHHAHPQAARSGYGWLELDVTYGIIWLLKRLGLASNVVPPPLHGRRLSAR
jgi:stearoyl-CoA desaturase (delta-9 desaturase)